MDGGTNATLWGLVKTCENALLGIANLLAPITWPFVVLLRLVLLAIAFIFHLLAKLIVDSTAAFMSAVLTHPNVVEAASQIMVNGMNAFAEQPDLSERLKAVNQNMTQKDKEAAAVQIGRDLPVLVGGIVHGVFSRGNNNNDKNSEEEKSSDDNDNKTANNNDSDNKKESSTNGKVVLYVNDGNGDGKIVETNVPSSSSSSSS